MDFLSARTNGTNGDIHSRCASIADERFQPFIFVHGPWTLGLWFKRKTRRNNNVGGCRGITDRSDSKRRVDGPSTLENYAVDCILPKLGLPRLSLQTPPWFS